jgi:hypothetical protein
MQFTFSEAELHGFCLTLIIGLNTHPMTENSAFIRSAFVSHRMTVSP